MINKIKSKLANIFTVVLVGVIMLGLFVLYKNYIIKNTPPFTIDKILNAEIPKFDTEESKMVTLVNGEVKGVYEYDGKGIWSLWMDKSRTIFDDFNNDGTQDAIAIVTSYPGGTGHYSHLVLFTNKNGVPKYVASKILGDRVDIKSVTYAERVLSVDLITQSPGEPMCCGTLREVYKYKMVDNSLLEV